MVVVLGRGGVVYDDVDRRGDCICQRKRMSRRVDGKVCWWYDNMVLGSLLLNRTNLQLLQKHSLRTLSKKVDCKFTIMWYNNIIL